jgi:hypothetical protein
MRQHQRIDSPPLQSLYVSSTKLLLQPCVDQDTVSSLFKKRVPLRFENREYQGLRQHFLRRNEWS